MAFRDVQLTKEEEAAIKELAIRQRDSDKAESMMMLKYANRASLARQVWVIAASCVVTIVTGTMYVLTIKNQVDQNSKAILELQIIARQNQDSIYNLRIDMKDKADRKTP